MENCILGVPKIHFHRNNPSTHCTLFMKKGSLTWKLPLNIYKLFRLKFPIDWYVYNPPAIKIVIKKRAVNIPKFNF